MSNEQAAAAAKLVADSDRYSVSLPLEQVVKLLVQAVSAQADDVASIKAVLAPPVAPPAPEPDPVTVTPAMPQAPTDEQLAEMFRKAGLTDGTDPAKPEGGAL